ncbi:MAG: putative toxin-antitoxin system toxin component, PIN family [Verrucomicrobia bacterium]|nr:MAG: putative toxin-antitoxin system toxin component, PIN family [Verrucomicrobiota bacterium]PYJ88802.1 MAG: putative toxin-antitoxin system toxin component, PIN family [Verrucomicrobiota bacterium]
MRVVFDTNVLYSAFAAKGFCEEVLDEAAGDCVTIWSNPLKQELELLLARRHKIGPATKAALAAYADLCEFVEPLPLPARVCRDKDDDIVLATAVAGKANVIVTGDDDLLALKKFRDIRILSPRQFLEFLDRG